jgi:sulfofructosephosphate aldolase
MTPTLDALARPTGTFAMVAMDQRESLRTMFRDHGLDDGDARYARFKATVARELGPLASGFLIESGQLATVAPHVPRGLILAVDGLVQETGGPVEDTRLDAPAEIDPRVVALKLLVIWRDDGRRAERVELARSFVALAARHGLLSVLEPVVRVPEADREDAIVEAARELGALRPSLYKCQVPLAGRGDPEEITRHARRIDAVLPVPWVVLSQGVEPDAFPRAVEAACRGGASGCLAGRALWTAAVGDDDPSASIRAVSVPRLQELGRIVDEHGRPWRGRPAPA